MTTDASLYVGRFAPSPSGPLHFGSLVCALASYLDAKANHGKWLVRMEDIDPPREDPNAKHAILETLANHGMHWDGDILFQSTRTLAYQQALSSLEQRGLSYPCQCTRKQLNARNCTTGYDQHCLKFPPQVSGPFATRLNRQAASTLTDTPIPTQFTDNIQGRITIQPCSTGDFIIHRKDGLFAYNLAVVVDDLNQGITHIVRGADLLDTTLQQQSLIAALTVQRNVAPPIQYSHVPIVVDTRNQKLSKQNHAPAINNNTAQANLRAALLHLQIIAPAVNATTEELLQWGVERWDITRLRPIGKQFDAP